MTAQLTINQNKFEIIKGYSEKDINQIDNINSTTGWTDPSTTERIHKLLSNSFDTKRITILLAKIDQIVKGYIIIRKQESSPDYISYLAIAQDSKKKNYGSKLLFEAIQQSSKRGIILDCRSKVIDFYEKVFQKAKNNMLIQGYKMCEERPYQNGDRKYSFLVNM